MPEDKSHKSQTTTFVKSAGKKKVTKHTSISKQYCGIIMPISLIDGCNEQHWADVREIIESAVVDSGFDPRLVSDADEVGIIQKRIIQNVYDDPVVVCDVSGKNPNVMFELGMRLAFDKPTIIVKDDKTTYTFDTAPIEHLEYPRDLRFSKIVEFQENLTSKIEATHKKALTDKNYTTFLKNFGSFSVAKLETRPLERDDFILEELRTLKSIVLRQPRIADEYTTGKLFEDRETRGITDISNMQQKFIHREVQVALQKIGPRKSRKDLRALILREILRPEFFLPECFRSPMEFERALERELTKIGLAK